MAKYTIDAGGKRFRPLLTIPSYRVSALLNTLSFGIGMPENGLIKGLAILAAVLLMGNTFSIYHRITSGNESILRASPVGALSTTITS